MADEELRKILEADTETEPPLDAPAASAQDQETAKKAAELANLQKAIAEAQGNLKTIRKDIKAAKTGGEHEEDDEETPRIDLKDPSARAWDRHIKETSAPVQREIDQAKDERMHFALRDFLTDKPALTGNSEKMKSLMETYSAIKRNSGLTTEGILLDLERAYAAENADTILAQQRRARIERARQDAEFSEIGVTHGSGSERNESAKPRKYTQEELDIIRDMERHGAPKI